MKKKKRNLKTTGQEVRDTSGAKTAIIDRASWVLLYLRCIFATPFKGSIRAPLSFHIRNYSSLYASCLFLLAIFTSPFFFDLIYIYMSTKWEFVLTGRKKKKSCISAAISIYIVTPPPSCTQTWSANTLLHNSFFFFSLSNSISLYIFAFTSTYLSLVLPACRYQKETCATHLRHWVLFFHSFLFY